MLYGGLACRCLCVRVIVLFFVANHLHCFAVCTAWPFIQRLHSFSLFLQLLQILSERGGWSVDVIIVLFFVANHLHCFAVCTAWPFIQRLHSFSFFLQLLQILSERGGFALPPITSIGSVPISSISVNGPVPLMIWLLGSVGTPMVSNILLSNNWHVSDRR